MLRPVFPLCCLFLLFSLLPGSVLMAASIGSPSDSVVAKFLQVQNSQAARLSAYRATRLYVLRVKSRNEESAAEVQLRYEEPKGEQFNILRWTGAGGFYRFALERVLESESFLTRPQNRPRLRLSAENYTFEYLGQDEIENQRCYVLRLEPRRKVNSLLEGRVWINQQDYGLIRIEGRVAASSFWIGQPSLIQSFRRINGFSLLSESNWTTHARVFGETSLKIEALWQEAPLDSSAPGEALGGER